MIFLIQNYQDFLLADFYLPFGRSFAYYLPNGRSVRYVSSIVVVPEFIWDLVLSGVGQSGPGFVQFSSGYTGAREVSFTLGPI